MHRNRGFTLIEVMIVVAIVGILSMIAMPSYRNYIEKTYVAEALNNLLPLKMAMIEHHMNEGTPALNMDELVVFKDILIPEKWRGGKLIPSAATNVYGYGLLNGSIYIYFDDEFKSGDKNFLRELQVIPSYDEGSVTWYCGLAALKKFGAGNGNFQYSTGIPDSFPHYLPASCL